MRKLYLSLFISLMLLLGAVTEGFAANYPTGVARLFMKGETTNSYVPDTTVQDHFRPQFGATFNIKYLEIPVNELHLIDSHMGSEGNRAHFIVIKNGKNYVRFFIHPESVHLYQPLINKYKVVGTYIAAATASTRTLLAWPENDPKNLVFLKLSLAQVQDKLGRIVPGWEVRRSVGISEIAGQTPEIIWMNSGASIIPEFAGAYVDASLNLPFYVDENQGNVLEHGLIARDASFLNEFPNDITIPLFAIFSRQANGDAPLIIQMWKAQNDLVKISFVEFVGEYLFKPFLEKNKYLLFHQGIVPEFHGQNVVVVLDKKTKRIKHFFHRDVGSMKVDLRLRWVHGLSVDALRTSNAQYDFKFTRAPQSIEDNFVDYLNDWLFRRTYLDEIRKYVPDFNPKSTEKLLLKMAGETLRSSLPLRSGKSYKKFFQHLWAYYAENPPDNLAVIPNLEAFDAMKVKTFISNREANGQIVELPSEWKDRFAQLPAVTEYGVAYLNVEGSLLLALHSSDDLREIQKVGAPKYSRFRNPTLQKLIQDSKSHPLGNGQGSCATVLRNAGKRGP